MKVRSSLLGYMWSQYLSYSINYNGNFKLTDLMSGNMSKSKYFMTLSVPVL